jgi:hypothetical protein
MAQEIALGLLWPLASTGGHKGPYPTSTPLPPLRVGHQPSVASSPHLHRSRPYVLVISLRKTTRASTYSVPHLL